jgi:hypothetical protein
VVELLELPVEPLSIHTVENLNAMCKLMPTVKESCFNSEQVCSIDNALKVYFTQSYVRTLMIHEYSSSVLLGGILYGSVKSIHCLKSSHGGNMPGFIERYARIECRLVTRLKQIAKVMYLIAHEQKDWYGTWAPAEVWNVYSSQAFGGFSEYVPIFNFICRCAFITHSIKFNNTTPMESVCVVVPLNHFIGL